MLSSVFPIALSLALAGRSLAATYNIAHSTEGNAFLIDFNVISEHDPTNGLVDYVSLADAQNLGLVSVVNGNFRTKADHTTVLTGGAGRKSVRMESVATYDRHVTIWNVNHMPTGCGTWPSLWEYGANWPYTGEVDILEGVNDQGPNSETLHTGPNCNMPTTQSMSGSFKAGQTNCDSSPGGPGTGCSVSSGKGANSYGPSFNANGGGWYAMERTANFVKIWFWPRGSSVPSDVNAGAASINTDNWGTPDSYFPSTSCDIDVEFGPHWLTIDLTFCGDWAGSSSIYASSGCPSTCEDYVSNNPSAFSEAYFEIPWVKVYQ
ncbi:glycoside hydrolase family 16 protein [Peniophora sp. CONT]|nr:glycoside hydrolase family 16 protein [Peniophora sp. CONT]